MRMLLTQEEMIERATTHFAVFRDRLQLRELIMRRSALVLALRSELGSDVQIGL